MLVSFLVTTAQDEPVPTIQYGETLEGILAEGQDEAEFGFTAKAGEIVLIEVINDDIMSGLLPELQLLNERGTKLAETSDIQDGLENLDNLKSKITIEIPADGDYTILVTDGPFESSQGNAKFLLRLLQPEILEFGQSVSDSTSNSMNSYFIVINNEPFSISYAKQGGEFSPAVNIDRIDNGKLERMASLYGNDLNSGIVNVTPNRNSLHLVTITRGIYDMDIFSTTTVDFTLQLVPE